MRVLILGLPGSGTSCVAECYALAGFSPCPPTFARGRWGYRTHESLLGRAVNRLYLGTDGSPHWPVTRWFHDFRERDTYDDAEMMALAKWFVSEMDRQHDHWFFKNPESLFSWRRVWSRFRWNEVVGVYRHPEAAIRSMHSAQKACYRRVVWGRWMSDLPGMSTRLVKFPDDVPELAADLEVESPVNRTFEPEKYDPLSEKWCRVAWRCLEDHRWRSTPAIAT